MQNALDFRFPLLCHWMNVCTCAAAVPIWICHHLVWKPKPWLLRGSCSTVVYKLWWSHKPRVTVGYQELILPCLIPLTHTHTLRYSASSTNEVSNLRPQNTDILHILHSWGAVWADKLIDSLHTLTVSRSTPPIELSVHLLISQPGWESRGWQWRDSKCVCVCVCVSISISRVSYSAISLTKQTSNALAYSLQITA